MTAVWAIFISLAVLGLFFMLHEYSKRTAAIAQWRSGKYGLLGERLTLLEERLRKAALLENTQWGLFWSGDRSKRAMVKYIEIVIGHWLGCHEMYPIEGRLPTGFKEWCARVYAEALQEQANIVREAENEKNKSRQEHNEKNRREEQELENLRKRNEEFLREANKRREEQEYRRREKQDEIKQGTETCTLESSRRILGVDSAASLSEIEAAYRRMVTMCHPDKHGGDPRAAGWFKKVQEAYECLAPLSRSSSN